VPFRQVQSAKQDAVVKRTKELIKRIKPWCADQGIRQQDLAKMLGVSPQLITEWIKGRKEPMGEQVLHLLEILSSKTKTH
jgi:transcriptional regulator with XRE-family HTH domain